MFDVALARRRSVPDVQRRANCLVTDTSMCHRSEFFLVESSEVRSDKWCRPGNPSPSAVP